MHQTGRKFQMLIKSSSLILLGAVVYNGALLLF